MTIQVKEKNGITYIEIKDEMTIYSALEQKNQLSHHLKADQELQINLSEVSEIDSAGLQILLFLKQEATTKNIILSLFH
ncbi:MAG: STAS domain-containing protein, partial [Methylococcales bacterium]|nr:STAS domain-containing protein [Methylococcales bacterium]